ncbi:(Fe-S)-binding protein [Thermodesulfovibrionales bacterium]|nr:(Fe-S)-binding protein [Thermodesulfovibrionales bacterium]
MSKKECVRCGGCKALCPTYREDANEAMSARGRAVLLKKFSRGEIKPSKTLSDRIFSCVLCGACSRLCPLGINITDTIYKGRNNLRGFTKRRIFCFGLMLGFQKRYAVFKLLKVLEGINRTFPIYKIRPFKPLRDIDIRLAGSPLRDGVSVFRAVRPKGRVALFAGCATNFLYPYTGKALINGLNSINYDAILPAVEVCCGAPLRGLGFEKEAARLAEKNIRAFKKLNVEAIISLCPTCIHLIKNEYKGLIGDGMDIAMEASQFFSSKLKEGGNGLKDFRLQSRAPKLNIVSANRLSPLSVIYHAPCHSIYNLDAGSEAIQILKSIGFNIIDVERGCCGFGGTFRFLNQRLSEDILNRRIGEYKKADMIVTACPGCIFQLRTKIRDKRVVHIAEVINEALG